jgi:prolyl-tRNA synthetase
MMGGLGAHEYMAPCAAGENEVALSDAGYAANVEIATGTPPAPTFPASLDQPERAQTPDQRTIEEVSAMLGADPATLMKALPVVSPAGTVRLALVRGDHTLNEIKLRNALGEEARQATPEEILAAFGAEPGFIGPVGAPVEVIADSSLEHGTWITGANENGWHLRGVEAGRDFSARFADIRTVAEGDRCPQGGMIHIEPAIEVGNIFKLGTRYSEPLGAAYLDEDGKEQPIVMGSYGIGPARIMAAAIEQYADEHGISWPRSIAPFDVQLVGLGKQDAPERDLAERLYGELTEVGLDVLYDDRDASPGEKFVEAELLGCPLRVVAGKRSLDAGELEVQIRRGTEKRSVPIGSAPAALAALLAELP